MFGWVSTPPGVAFCFKTIMESILSEVFRALNYLLVAGVVTVTWKLAEDKAQGGKTKKVLWKGFLWCIAIAFFASLTLGKPTCVESDPVYGGCDEYAENGYEPTNEQREASFAYFMTLLYVPVVFGANNKKDES